MLKSVVSLLVLIVLSLLTTTWVALEQDGVLVVETHSIDGDLRATHIWFVENEGKIYLEGGNPNNPWVKDLESLDVIRIAGEGRDGEYRFTVNESPSHHDLIRNLMRRKYGWRDWWVDLLFDTSESSLIELEPISI